MMDHDGHIEKFHTTRFFTKGQNISRANFGVLDSSNKRTKIEKADLRTRRSNVFVLSFVFWKNEDRIN